MLEIRLNVLADIVDVFIVSEGNYTNAGEKKDLTLLNRINEGFLSEFRDKIIYVLQEEFPFEAEDGASVQRFMRRHLSLQGLSSLKGLLSDDDLFIYSDADEVPREEILTFFKLYDGDFVNDVVSFEYRWSIFGFFWPVDPNLFRANMPLPALVTISAFMKDFGSDASRLRDTSVNTLRIKDAGWHCSWCFDPEGIRRKMRDAPRSDYPRYGDHEAKMSDNYIRRLIQHGVYFDLTPFNANGAPTTPERDPNLAPDYVLKNPTRFQHLIRNIYYT